MLFKKELLFNDKELLCIELRDKRTMSILKLLDNNFPRVQVKSHNGYRATEMIKIPCLRAGPLQRMNLTVLSKGE